MIESIEICRPDMSKEVIMQEEFKERLKRHLEVIYPDGQIDVLAESVLSLFPLRPLRCFLAGQIRAGISRIVS